MPHATSQEPAAAGRRGTARSGAASNGSARRGSVRHDSAEGARHGTRHIRHATVALSSLTLYFLAGLCRAQTVDSLTAPLVPRDSIVWTPSETDVLSLGLEVVPSPAEGSFFEEYDNLGGRLDRLEATAALTLTARLVASNAVRWTFTGGYMGVGFNEIYEARAVVPADTGLAAVPLASVTEKFEATVIPLMGGVEWAPIRSQFTSYVGALAGVSVSSVSWTSGTVPTGVADVHRPVTNVRGIGISPAARIFAGIDLRFDYFSTVGGPFRGIFVEAAYLYLPLSRDYFGELRRSARGLPLLPGSDNGTINAGGLSVTFGFSVQFPRKKKSGSL